MLTQGDGAQIDGYLREQKEKIFFSNNAWNTTKRGNRQWLGPDENQRGAK